MFFFILTNIVIYLFGYECQKQLFRVCIPALCVKRQLSANQYLLSFVYLLKCDFQTIINEIVCLWSDL